MEQVESISLFLRWGMVVLVILSALSLRKGVQLAGKYKGTRKKINNKKPRRHLASNNHGTKFSEQSILNAAERFGRRSSYYFAFDTDVLLEHPFVLKKIANETNTRLLISQQVRYELDRKKDGDAQLGDRARIALKAIANLHKEEKLEIVRYNEKFLNKNGLHMEVPDDRVIGSYLERKRPNEKVMFITNDNNARTTARTTALTPLELDWEENKKQQKVKEVEFRPGYTYKVISIILLSLAVGFFFGRFYVEVEVGAKIVDQPAESLGEASFSGERPAFVAGEFPYVIKSEYDDVYQGKKVGDWGASAFVDTKFSEGHTFWGASYSIMLGSWVNGELEGKRNKLKYVLALSDGAEIIADTHLIRPYNNESGIQLESLDTRVKFTGVNSSEEITFELDRDDTVERLDGATVKLVHKVSGDVIQTFPVEVKKK